MELIKCDRTHLRQVTQLYHQTIAHLERTVNYPRWSSAHPSDKGIQDAVLGGDQYLCTEKGSALGAVVLSENPEGYYEAGDWRQALHAGEYLVIHALAVHPHSRQQGIGSFMVEQCIQLARQGGYKALRLDVVPHNTPAVRLYEKMGFSYAGTKDLRRNIDGVPVFDLFELNLLSSAVF